MISQNSRREGKLIEIKWMNSEGIPLWFEHKSEQNEKFNNKIDQ